MQRAILRLFKENNEKYRLTVLDNAGYCEQSLQSIFRTFSSGNAAVKLLNSDFKLTSFFKQLTDYNYRPTWRKHPLKLREEQPYRIHPITGDIEQNPYFEDESDKCKVKDKGSIKKNSFTLLNKECTTKLFYSACAIVVDFSQVELKQAFKADGHSNFRWWYGTEDKLKNLKEKGGEINGWNIIPDILITGKNKNDQRRNVHQFVNSTIKPHEVLIEPTKESLSCILITSRNDLSKAKEFQKKSGVNLPIILYNPNAKKLTKSIPQYNDPLVSQFMCCYKKKLSEDRNAPFFGWFRGAEWNYKQATTLEKIFTHAFLEEGNRSRYILYKLGWITSLGKINYKNKNLTEQTKKTLESIMNVIQQKRAAIQSNKIVNYRFQI